MKLDTKRTVLVGFAFLSICAFWQMYDNLVPLILTNTFHLNETLSGAIMAADNVLALFLLPLFGGISDKCKSPLGRRRPFLLFGTLTAIALMLMLPLLADSINIIISIIRITSHTCKLMNISKHSIPRLSIK